VYSVPSVVRPSCVFACYVTGLPQRALLLARQAHATSDAGGEVPAFRGLEVSHLAESNIVEVRRARWL
jgi:hypothetical protein